MGLTCGLSASASTVLTDHTANTFFVGAFKIQLTSWSRIGIQHDLVLLHPLYQTASCKPWTAWTVSGFLLWQSCLWDCKWCTMSQPYQLDQLMHVAICCVHVWSFLHDVGFQGKIVSILHNVLWSCWKLQSYQAPKGYEESYADNPLSKEQIPKLRKVTSKKGTGFYIRAAATFLRGTADKPPVPSVILSGSWEASLRCGCLKRLGHVGQSLNVSTSAMVTINLGSQW